MPVAQDGEREAEGRRPPLVQDGEGSQIETTDAPAQEPAGFTPSSPNMAAPSLSPIASALHEEESRGSSSDRLPEDMAYTLRQIMAEYAAKRPNEVRRESVDRYSLTVETEFCDVDDGSFQSCKARKVAVLASKSVVSLSSFSDGKRLRVCSGFMIGSDPCTNNIKILTSATLVRSICARNILIPDVKVKVGLPNGHMSDGLISMVDFHYNLAVVEVNSNEKLTESILAKKVTKRGAVLALGRFYDHGGVMCAQGKITKQASTFECSELLVSSCHTTMAGVGGPLVNDSGHVVGINFYGENHTPFLSSAVIIRCLDHWKNYGKIIRPWLGLIYTPIDVLPLRVLDKCTYVDDGFYISKVAEGSPADVAGVCVGDVLVECAGKVLSTAPKFGTVLLDMCEEHMEGDTLRNNLAVEVVVRKQSDGSIARKTMFADVLSESNYYRWVDPLPKYNEERKPIYHGS